MESTLKIAHNREHDVCPVIKIVMPLSLHDKIENPASDVDEKDILLRDFLFKKFTRQTNQWFKIHCNFSTPDENPTHTVSTIRALPQEMLSIEFQSGIIDLLYCAGYENSDERFTRVDEFFNWLNGEIRSKKSENQKVTRERIDLDIHSQEYFNVVTAPVIELLNTYHPHHSIIIDCNSAELLEGKMAHHPRLTDPKIRKILSDKSIRYIFEMLLPDEARINAFQNTPRELLDDEVDGVLDGMKKAFNWTESKEGYHYWDMIINEVVNKEK